MKLFKFVICVFLLCLCWVLVSEGGAGFYIDGEPFINMDRPFLQEKMAEQQAEKADKQKDIESSEMLSPDGDGVIQINYHLLGIIEFVNNHFQGIQDIDINGSESQLNIKPNGYFSHPTSMDYSVDFNRLWKDIIIRPFPPIDGPFGPIDPINPQPFDPPVYPRDVPVYLF